MQKYARIFGRPFGCGAAVQLEVTTSVAVAVAIVMLLGLGLMFAPFFFHFLRHGLFSSISCHRQNLAHLYDNKTFRISKNDANLKGPHKRLYQAERKQ